MGSRYRKPHVAHYLSPDRYAKSEHTVSGEPSHAQVLQLGVVENPVLRALPADAGLLDTPERGDLIRDQAGVESHDAVFQGFGDAPGTGEVSCVKVGSQAEFSVVSHPDRIRF